MQLLEIPFIQILVITGSKEGCWPVIHLKVMLPVFVPTGVVSYEVPITLEAYGCPEPAQTPVLFPLFLELTVGHTGALTVKVAVFVQPVFAV
jgi:hypothetical protein